MLILFNAKSVTVYTYITLSLFLKIGGFWKLCACRVKVDSYLLAASTRVRARTYTRYSVHFYVRIRAYVRPRVQASWTFKTGVDIPSNQMRLRGSRSTNGCRRHGNLRAHTRVGSYLKFNTQLRSSILALGVAQRGAYARWWSQKVWIQLNTYWCQSLSPLQHQVMTCASNAYYEGYLINIS